MGFVWPDPELDHLVAVPAAERTVTDSDPDAINRFSFVDTLEMKVWMERVVFPLRVRPFRLLLDPFGKKGK